MEKKKLFYLGKLRCNAKAKELVLTEVVEEERSL